MQSDCEPTENPLKKNDARDKWSQAPLNPTGWRTIYAAIHLRMRFAIVLMLLAALATGWPWLTNVWERVFARVNPYSLDSSVVSGTDYFCPMDPGVVSDWPAICPVCNMDLIRRQKSDSQLLPSGVLARMQISPYRIALAGVRTVTVVTSPVKIRSEESHEREPTPAETSEQQTLVPVTSIVYWESETVVYVESMPGMFDALPVKLSQREGNSYIVKSGLQPGQKVVAVGTLLIDAESRLHPHLSTQYFGAATQASNAQPPPIPRSIPKPTKSLEAADVSLVELQRYCPVTQVKLGSMGTPVFVEVVGRKIALCCEGCRSRILADPVPYLSWLDERLANEQAVELPSERTSK